MSFHSYCDVLSGKMKGGELDLSIGGSLEFEMWPLHSKMKADECKLVGARFNLFTKWFSYDIFIYIMRSI